MPAASRSVRLLWVLVGSVFTVVVLGFGTAQAVAGLAHEERDERTVIDGPVSVLDIVADGSITIIGTSDRGSVTIEEHISDGIQSPDRSVETDGDRLVVRGTCIDFLATFCSDDFVVRVPRDVRVVAHGEGVTLRGMTGGAELTSDGSSIDVIRSSGAMRLSSHGGEITGRGLGLARVEASSYGGNISLAFAVPPLHVDASSHGGHVSVALPDNNATYRVDTSSAGGSTDTLVRTDPDSDRTIVAESYGGDVTVRYVSAREQEF